MDGVFTHLAIVDNPRYERANIVFNSKTAIVDNDKWITIHPNGEDGKGRHLLLKDGENVYDAMQRQWGISSPGQQHLFSVSKYKTDDNYKKELNAKISELNKQVEKSRDEEAKKEAKKINDEFIYGDNISISEYDKKARQFETKYGRPLVEVMEELETSTKQSMPSLEDYKNPSKDYELPAIPSDILKKIGKEYKPLILKKNIIEKNKEHHPEVGLEEYNDILDSGIYKANVIFKTKKNDDYYNFAHYDSAGNPQILIELADNKDNYEIVNFYKMSDKNLQRKLKQAIKRVDNEGGQFLIDIEDNTSKVGVLSNLEIDSVYIITDIQEDFNPDINKVHNNKEQDMALIDELKKLITKVENEKPEGENMDDDKKIENEKVDKRKLIDEVAGIMKSAGADDEKIRTAIAKMEKLAYDKSEAGTADNEKEDDKPADDSKVENEETKKDEDEYKDLKKDVKEDVKNKCKNSVDNAKGGYFDKMNEVYNSPTEVKKENAYISRAQKLKDAEAYFCKVSYKLFFFASFILLL